MSFINRVLPLKGFSYHQRLSIAGFSFSAPVLFFFLLFSVFPMLSALYFSFTDYDIVSDPIFTGIENYKTLFSDKNFRMAIGVSAKYALLYSPISIILSFFIAWLLNAEFKGKNFYRLIFFSPTVLSTIGLATVWRIMLGREGPVNAIFGLRIPWLTDPEYALWAIVMMAVWKTMGYYVIIFLVGLQAIPNEYYEAATVDGANAFSLMRSITLPLMRPTFALVVIITIIESLKVFAPMYIMTNGGPANSTRPAVMLIYQTGFKFWKMGLASAESIVLFIAMLILTTIQLRLFRIGEDV